MTNPDLDGLDKITGMTPELLADLMVGIDAIELEFREYLLTVHAMLANGRTVPEILFRFATALRDSPADEREVTHNCFALALIRIAKLQIAMAERREARLRREAEQVST